MLIIDEDNWRDQIGENGEVIDATGERRKLACFPRKVPVGGVKCATLATTPLIPRNEFGSRWRDIKQARADMRSLLADKGIFALDQERTSTCHAQSAALGLMAARARAGEATVILSPGSIAGPVTGYVDAGAYIEDDLNQIVRGGAAAREFVPMNQISRRGWKPGAEANALLHRCEKWLDLAARDSQMFDRCATQILLGNVVCVAYNWWAHAVTLTGLVEISSNRFGFEFRNSWGASYGEDGYATLVEGRGTPDAAYVPIAATASMM